MITSYNELPIGKYLQIVKVANEPGREPIDQQVAAVAILNGMSEDEVLEMPLIEYAERARAAAFLNASAPDMGGKVKKRYTVGEWTLVPALEVGRMSTAQYVDFHTYVKAQEPDLVAMMSCLLVPEGKKYNQDYDVVEVQNAIREGLSTADCYALQGFFLRQLARLTASTLNYLESEAKKLKRKEKNAMMKQIQEIRTFLQPSGAGLQM